MDILSPRMIALLVIVGVVLLVARRGGAMALGPTLVLRRFHVDPKSASGVYVEIIGRPEGLLGWLLTTLGIDSEVTLSVSDHDVTKEESSLAGRKRTVVPLQVIASGAVGYTKSIVLLFLGLIVVIWGVVSGLLDNGAPIMVLALLVGGTMLAVYWLSNRLQFSIETFGGSILGLKFKRSVIENVAVDFDKAAAVVELLHDLMLRTQARPGTDAPSPHVAATSTTGRPPAAAPAPVQPAARSELSTGNVCPKCKARVDPSNAFCESCGERLRS
jgi:hypothetical protein